jgi:hypothetical protein
MSICQLRTEIFSPQAAEKTHEMTRLLDSEFVNESYG